MSISRRAPGREPSHRSISAICADPETVVGSKMTLPILPLLIEIHYRCDEDTKSRWLIDEIAFSQAERDTIDIAVKNGYLELLREGDCGMTISITEFGREIFGFPRPRSARGCRLKARFQALVARLSRSRQKQGT